MSFARPAFTTGARRWGGGGGGGGGAPTDRVGTTMV